MWRKEGRMTGRAERNLGWGGKGRERSKKERNKLRKEGVKEDRKQR